MTAFARGTQTHAMGELSWELRSVNHRYFEPNIRLPEELRGLDPTVRARLGQRIERGKVDCTLRYAPTPGGGDGLRVNTRLLEQLLAATAFVADRLGVPAIPAAFDVLRWPGMLEEPPRDLDALAVLALGLLDDTLGELLAAREREGGRLAELIARRCDGVAGLVAAVRERRPVVLASQRQRILDRLAEVRAEIDPARLEQELALLAQRGDVDEELDRLVGHVEETRQTLLRGGPVGRRLDFLMQEFNREANTLASKSADGNLTRLCVDMKVLIEQMREQVQNIE